MQENNSKLPTFLIGFIVGTLLVAISIWIFYDNLFKEKTIEKNVTVEQPLVMYQLADWADNLDNPGESLFRGYVYNFGELEVKNVEITCRTFNGDIILDSYTENIGNLGSLSDKYIEISHKMNSNVIGVTANCVVTNISSGINLLERMPSYKKYYP